MSGFNIKPSKEFVVLATIEPQTLAGGSAAADNTGWIDVSGYEWVMFIVSVGTVGSGATVTPSFEQATAVAGTSAKALTAGGFTATARTVDGETVYEEHTDKLDIANGFRWVRASLTSAVGNIASAGILCGVTPRYRP